MMRVASVLAALLLAQAAVAPSALAQAAKSQQAIAGQGKVNSVDAKASKVNLTHGPIDALKWPAMTMDFVVLPGVDLSAVRPGDNVTFTLGRAPDGMYAINGIRAQ